MRKWIIMALVNWLRKPANRQKAKDAWRDVRGRNNANRTPQQPQATPRDTTAQRPGNTFDNRP
jgi:hypothetical protein